MKKNWGIAITVLLLALVIINAFILFEHLGNQKAEDKCRCCFCCDGCCEDDEKCRECDVNSEDCDECCYCCCCCKNCDDEEDLNSEEISEEDRQKESSSYGDGNDTSISRGYMAFALSKTTSDLSKISNIETSGDIQEASEFSITVTQDSDEVLELIADIYDFVSGNNVAPIKYFSEDISLEIAKLLPAGTDLEALSMNEYVTVETCGCDANQDQGQAQVYFDFATKYENTQHAVALVGIFSDRDQDGKLGVEWIPLETNIIDGGLEVKFDLDTLKKMNDNKCAFAVLNTPTT